MILAYWSFVSRLIDDFTYVAAMLPMRRFEWVRPGVVSTALRVVKDATVQIEGTCALVESLVQRYRRSIVLGDRV